MTSTPTSVLVPPTSATSESLVAGEERRPADAVGRAAADREDRVAEGLVQAHQRAVVLREERGRAAGARPASRCIAMATVAGHPGQRAVQDRGVLALQQAQRADLVAERDVDLAQLPLDDLARPPVRAAVRRGENAGDRDPVGGARDLAEEPRDRVGVQRGQVPSVELDAAVDDHRAGRDRGGEVRPASRTCGRMLCVAGPPIRMTAIRRSFLRSSTAFVAWVVPSITWVIRCGSDFRVPGAPVSIAVVIPRVMSGVPGTLALAITRSAASMITASVLVPPTSMPRRQSGAAHRRTPLRADSRRRNRTHAAR